jgi:hypothetical protein
LTRVPNARHCDAAVPPASRRALFFGVAGNGSVPAKYWQEMAEWLLGEID